MAAALGVFKNVLLRIGEFLFEFYILGCQTLSAAQLKAETGFRGQSVLNRSAAHRWRLIKSQISGKQSLLDGCNFTLSVCGNRFESSCHAASCFQLELCFHCQGTISVLKQPEWRVSLSVQSTAALIHKPVSLHIWPKIMPEAKELFDWSESSVFC